VDFGQLFQWEWLLIEVLVLGLAVAELISLRRTQRRDRETKVELRDESRK
jgi:uncharacterized protein YpmS